MPTSADDVFIDANSGGGAIAVLGSGAANCAKFDTTGFTGSMSGGNVNVSGTVITLSASGTFSNLQVQTVASVTCTVTSNGKSLNTFGMSAGSSQVVSLADAMTIVNAVTHALGSFTTNNFSLTCGSLVSNTANTRTLTLGSSSITVTGTSSNVWNIATSTGLTVTANTATITFTGASQSFSAGVDMNGASAVIASTATGFAGLGGTWQNVTKTGGAVKTDTMPTSALTVRGTYTVNGNSAVNRLLISSSAGVGTARTITAATVVVTNADFQDIAGAGAGSWDLHAITGLSGDCGGNSGITFTAPATQTHTASAGGNWSDVTKWTSRVPLPQDNVIVDVNTTGTLTVDMPRLGASIDFTGFAATANWSIATSLFGSQTLSGGTYQFNGFSQSLAGRSSFTITSAGKSINATVTIGGPGGTYSLQDAFNTTSGITVNDGTLASNNFSITTPSISAGSARAHALNFGTSIVTLTGTSGTLFLLSTTVGALTLTASAATFVVSAASTSARTWSGASFGYSVGTITYTVANSPGQLVITGANTFTSLNIGPGRQLQMPASTTNTFANAPSWSGSPNGYLYLPGVSGAYASAPDTAALSITGDIDIRCAVALDSWGAAAQQSLVSKFGVTPGHRSYRLALEASTGIVQFFASVDGSASTVVADSTVAPTVSAGGLLAIRATCDVDNGAAGRDIKFYTKATTAATADADTLSDSGWTQLGSTVTQAGTTSIADTDAIVEIGSDTTGTVRFAAGKFYAAVIKNGLAGTTVFNADFTAKTVGANSFTESSTNAATVTINGVLAQAGDGRVALTSSTGGTQATINYTGAGVVNSDYLTVQDSNATPGSTWYAGTHSTNVSNNTGWTFTAGDTGTMSLSLALTAIAAAKAVPTASLSLSASAAAAVSATATASLSLVMSSSARAVATDTASIELLLAAAAASAISATADLELLVTISAAVAAAANMTLDLEIITALALAVLVFDLNSAGIRFGYLADPIQAGFEASAPAVGFVAADTAFGRQ